ncbi:MAG TPA: YSC84-related protein, partial [Vicinamibacterales bacterium]|nr:YSC84-related protein [Vicinamibacterales bacterium]
SNQVKLGADVAASAGPKGRNLSAATDATMRAEVLSYSRARGLFAGISLEGSTLRTDDEANERLYGKKVEARAVVIEGQQPAPASASRLLGILTTKSPKNLSGR